MRLFNRGKFRYAGRSYDGFATYVALRDSPHCTLDDVKVCVENGPAALWPDASAKVRRACLVVFGVLDEKVAVEFDKWADDIRKKYRPMADMAVAFGLEKRRLSGEERLGLYLNVQRATFRRQEIFRQALLYSGSTALPPQWYEALAEAEGEGSAYGEVFSSTSTKRFSNNGLG